MSDPVLLSNILWLAGPAPGVISNRHGSQINEECRCVGGGNGCPALVRHCNKGSL